MATKLLFALCCCVASTVAPLDAAPLRHAGLDVKLSLARLSDYTIEVKLTPKQRSAPAAVSTVLSGDLAFDVRWEADALDEPADVRVGPLRFQIAASPLTLTVRDPSGATTQRLVWSENEGNLTFLTPTPVFGLGEGGLGFDRRGHVQSMADGWAAVNRPILGSRVAAPFLIGSDGWGLFLPDLPGQKGEFDLTGGRGVFRAGDDPATLPLRVLLIVSRDPARIVTEYYRLVGRAPMPPKWALGFMQSHRTLAGPDEILEIARAFREKELPCDALIYLGTGYCPAGWNTGHGSLEFNPATFDDPARILGELHDRNFRVVLHGNAPPEDLHGRSIGEPSDDASHIRNYWARHRAADALGVDGWWPDDGDELPREARLARHRAYYLGQLLEQPGRRPWALHRTGYAGVARYGGWMWTGDPESRWATLAAHVAIGLNHSVSLTPFWGSDIGGFFPTAELTGELYVRWFQFGAFCPSFRAHGRTWRLRLPWGWNTGEPGPVEHTAGPDPFEFHNAEVEPICRDYLNLRYRLLPYNYTLAREAHDTGLPMMRPLWLYHPDDPEAVRQARQYLWGRDILVAPVVEKGATSRSVYLPAGDWYDWWTNQKLAGAQTVSRRVDLATLPLYVRAGAIIPLDPVRQFTAQAVSGPTTIQVYSGADGDFVLYDDDSSIRFTWSDAARRLRVEGSSDVTHTFLVRLLPEPTGKPLTFSGRPVELQF